MDLSIIVPTYNEGANVIKLVKAIITALHQVDYSYEIIFVDDSCDETPLVLENLSKQYHQVRFHHRPGERGLGTAVVKGFQLATGRYLLVMDADLQHPPELIPSILHQLEQGTQLVIPSRFVRGGDDGGLNIPRKLISWTARILARTFLARVRPINDCTGGYFAFHSEVIDNIELKPIGWKILIEILVKGHYTRVLEIPYRFQARKANISKMNFHEQFNYLKHLIKLVADSPEDRRFILFCLIGFLGFLVNITIFTIIMQISNNQAILSSVIASGTAMLHNFLLNDRFTWPQFKAEPDQKYKRMLKFASVCLIGVIIAVLVLRTFLFFNFSPYLGQVAGLFAAVAWNYNLNSKWTWSK